MLTFYFFFAASMSCFSPHYLTSHFPLDSTSGSRVSLEELCGFRTSDQSIRGQQGERLWQARRADQAMAAEARHVMSVGVTQSERALQRALTSHTPDSLHSHTCTRTLLLLMTMLYYTITQANIVPVFFCMTALGIDLAVRFRGLDVPVGIDDGDVFEEAS